MTPARAPTGMLAGVDEAGLGPVLGPLVVAGVALQGPRGADPWHLLKKYVTRERHDPGKVRVADSKKVNQGKYGLERLERTALAFWGAWRGEIPETLGDLLGRCGIPLDGLARCPWYGDLDLRLPMFGDRDAVELFSHLLGRELMARGMSIIHIGVRPIDVEEFNASIATTNNKSETHFSVYSEVIAELLRAVPGDAHLVADRCGGRQRYVRALRRRLPGQDVRIVGEAPELSCYDVRDGRRRVRISFAARGEDRAFPTALASCIAKYVRESMMRMLNDWFLARLPQVGRTAGYYVDGNRFLQEIGPMIETADFPRHWLIRCR
jgi:ribonuclease HII